MVRTVAQYCKAFSCLRNAPVHCRKFDTILVFRKFTCHANCICLEPFTNHHKPWHESELSQLLLRCWRSSRFQTRLCGRSKPRGCQGTTSWTLDAHVWPLSRGKHWSCSRSREKKHLKLKKWKRSSVGTVNIKDVLAKRFAPTGVQNVITILDCRFVCHIAVEEIAEPVTNPSTTKAKSTTRSVFAFQCVLHA